MPSHNTPCYCSHSKAPSAVMNEKQFLHPAQLYTQPVGHFHDDTSWKWNNQTLQCRKKYLMLSGWSYSTSIFLLCLAREVFLSVSGICTEPSTSPPQHIRCQPPGAFSLPPFLQITANLSAERWNAKIEKILKAWELQEHLEQLFI